MRVRIRTSLLLLPLASCGESEVPPEPPHGPNVLIVSMDTTRVDRLGCYGHEAARTPNIDAIAGAGVRFERAYSPVPFTLPAHATLLSGVHPRAHGVHINMRGGVHPAVRTLAQDFQERGYRTGAFLAAWVLHEKFGLGRGFDHYDDIDALGDRNAQRPGADVTAAALEWLDAERARPFFAWVHYYDPHTPFEQHPELEAEFDHPYDAEIAYMDGEIGRLTGWLERHDLLDDTIVILAADHGEGLDDHGEEGHGMFLYDTTQHIPLLVRGPPPIRPGTLVSATVGLIDVAPTVHELMGWEPAREFEGHSLVPALRGEEQARAPVFLEAEYANVFGWAALEAVVTEEWKLVEAPRTELYRHGNELENLASERTDMVDRLRQVLVSHRRQGVERKAAKLATTESDASKLAALGYASNTTMPRQRDDLDDPKDHKEDLRVMLKAIAHMDAKRHDRVVATLEPHMQAVSNSPEMWIAFGSSLTAIGRHADAITALEHCSTIADESAKRLTALADAQIGLGRTQEALATLQSALDLDPEHAQTHSRLGRLHGQAGRLDKAIEHFEAYVEFEPDSANAHTNLASALFARKRFDEGLTHLRQALRVDPACAPAHRSLIQLFEVLGKRKETLEAMRAAARVLVNDPKPSARLSWELATAADVDASNAAEALVSARTAVDLAPQVATFHDVLAAAYANSGDYARASESAQRAFDLARQANDEALATAITARLALYSRGQPFRR